MNELAQSEGIGATSVDLSDTRSLVTCLTQAIEICAKKLQHWCDLNISIVINRENLEKTIRTNPGVLPGKDFMVLAVEPLVCPQQEGGEKRLLVTSRGDLILWVLDKEPQSHILDDQDLLAMLTSTMFQQAIKSLTDKASKDLSEDHQLFTKLSRINGHLL